MSKSLHLSDILHDEIKDLYAAEKLLLKAMPVLAGASFHETVQAAFGVHGEETKKHIERLEKIGKLLKKTSLRGRGTAMSSLIKRIEQLAKTSEPSAMHDVKLVAWARRIEHYEIAAYDATRALATELELTEAASLLESTLQEEVAGQDYLEQLTTSVHQRARDEGGGQPRMAAG